MRKKFLSGGYLPDHELLEMLLTFSIPRRNTNDIAHRLLAVFGTVEGVFAADRKQLLSVRGIGLESAIQIELIGRLLQHAERREEEGGLYLDTEKKLGEYAVELFRGMSGEAVYAVLMSSALRVTDCVCLSGGGYSGTEVDVNRLLESPWLLHSSTAVILHNHPEGRSEASEEDSEFAARVSELLSVSGISVIENVVVAGEKYRMLMKGMKPA